MNQPSCEKCRHEADKNKTMNVCYRACIGFNMFEPKEEFLDEYPELKEGYMSTPQYIGESVTEEQYTELNFSSVKMDDLFDADVNDLLSCNVPDINLPEIPEVQISELNIPDPEIDLPESPIKG